MAPIKCCVVGCLSNNETHRLFSLPKDDQLRSLWLTFLVPVNPLLSGLSKDQLVKKRVCQKHFDRYQFDAKGDRLQKGYPCLFSEKEIRFGIPLHSPVADLDDHNYCQEEIIENEASDLPVIATGHTLDHFYLPCSTKESKLRPPQTPLGKADNELLLPSTSGPSTSHYLESTKVQEIKEDSIQKLPKFKCSVAQRPLGQKLSKKINEKCKNFIKDIKNCSRKEQDKNPQENFFKRYANAKALSENKDFIKNIEKMPKHRQTFVLMQLKAVDKKKMSLRFTNEEKLLSLSLMKESPKGYRFLQKIFNLPSRRTLNRFTENILFETGVNKTIFTNIEKVTSKWDTKRKLCTIVFDEVALTPHVSFVESRDRIVGFLDLGDQRQSLRYCDHALVFMIRGICSSWRQPILYYFCEGSTDATSLTRILKEVVQNVVRSGLIPMALVCDQGSTFRTCLKRLKNESDRSRNLNGECDDGTITLCGQSLNIIYDPPHLLKGIRNNFLSKDMQFEGKIASWKDILTIFDLDSKLGHTRMLPNITEQHVIANKIKKMKVSVATQVLSANTSAMLKYTALFKTLLNGKTVSNTMQTTAEAVEFFDNLFDSVNGSRKTTRKGKLRGPIKAKTEHLEFWREAVKILEKIRFVDASSKRALRAGKSYIVKVPSLDGWIITLKSFERIAKLLFNKYEIEYFYPRNINQDPLENFFGRIRALNYRNVNPDALTFINSFKSLLMSNVLGPHSIYSNCEEDSGEAVLDFYNIFKTKDKENLNPEVMVNLPLERDSSSSETLLDAAITEKVRVHSSAYTAGFICRKMTKKVSCQKCKSTYISKNVENIHTWITHREYSKLKNRNLAYPNQSLMLLYRDCSELIHSYLNNFAHKPGVGISLKKIINEQCNLDWLGCKAHRKHLQTLFISIIIRLQVHNWCNIINKILKGAINENYVNKMQLPQKQAIVKYKANKLRNKKKIINSL